VASVAAKLLLYYSNLFNRLGIIANHYGKSYNPMSREHCPVECGI
jgi:hypothetical protein